MYRVHLDEAARLQLHRHAHQPGLAARTRDRLEMVRLSDSGWSVPRIAAHLQTHEQTVRRWIKTYLQDGFDALADQSHTGQTSAVTQAILDEVTAWLHEGGADMERAPDRPGSGAATWPGAFARAVAALAQRSASELQAHSAHFAPQAEP